MYQNGARVLQQWGLESVLEEAGMLKYSEGEVRNGKTGGMIKMQKDATSDCHTRMTVRKDLCAVLKKEALAKDDVTIEYDSPVIDYVSSSHDKLQELR